MFKQAAIKGLTPQQQLDMKIAGNPLVDADRLARGIMCIHFLQKEKGCEFFFALHRAQSILNSYAPRPPAIYVRGGERIESNGGFNLMLKKHAPLLSRHGLLDGVSISLTVGSRRKNCRKLRQNADSIIEQKSAEALQHFAGQKNPDRLLPLIARGLQIIDDIRFKAAFLELYIVAFEGVVNGTRAKVQESAERLWKAAEDAGLVCRPENQAFTASALKRSDGHH